MASGTARKKFAFALGVLAAVLLAGIYVAQLRGQFSPPVVAPIAAAPASAEQAARAGSPRVRGRIGSPGAGGPGAARGLRRSPPAPRRARSSRSRPSMRRKGTSRASGTSRAGAPARCVMPSRPTASPRRGCGAASARRAKARAPASRSRSVDAAMSILNAAAGVAVDALALAERGPVIPVIVMTTSRMRCRWRGRSSRAACRVLEVTLRTPARLHAIEAIAREVPEAIVGAGTVRAPADARAAQAAGAASP